MPRVAVAAFQHESNTFAPRPTTLDDFEITRGAEIVDVLGSSNHEIAGYFQGLSRHGIEAVPTISCLGTAGGSIEPPTFERLANDLLDSVEKAGHVDGLLLALHGAAHCSSAPDADGRLMQRLRERMPTVPIVVTIDAHANLSQAMVAGCDALVSYRTNPHLDTFERGLECADLIAGTLRGEIHPQNAGAFPPVAINILSQDTSGPACAPLYELADRVRRRPGILSVSICLGFPYADVPEMGASVNVVADRDAELAIAAATELASYLVESRHAFDAELLSPERAIAQAATVPGPVCVLDTGDNVGGGSPGDGTILAHLIRERGGPKGLVSIWDPESVAIAARYSPGDRVSLRIGGKADDLHGAPLEAEATVLGTYDGVFHDDEVRHGGLVDYHMGKTVVVESSPALVVQLTAERIEPFSLQQLLSCDIQPEKFQFLVAKGVHAPVPAYAPVSRSFVRAATPGCTSPDLSTLPYRNRRQPLFPLEEIPGSADARIGG